MNKAQMVEELSGRFEGNRKQARHALESVIDVIQRALVKGEKVAITGFGSFERIDRAARTARNPATGASVRVKKTSVPKFRPGADLKAVVSGAKKLPKLGAGGAGTAAGTAGTSRRSTGTAGTGRKAAGSAPRATSKRAAAATETAATTATKRSSTRKSATEAPATTAARKNAATKTSGTAARKTAAGTATGARKSATKRAAKTV